MVHLRATHSGQKAIERTAEEYAELMAADHLLVTGFYTEDEMLEYAQMWIDDVYGLKTTMCSAATDAPIVYFNPNIPMDADFMVCSDIFGLDGLEFPDRLKEMLSPAIAECRMRDL